MTPADLKHCTCAPGRAPCPTCRAWDTIADVLALVRDGAGFDDRAYRTARRALTPRHLRPLSLRLSRIERRMGEFDAALSEALDLIDGLSSRYARHGRAA